MNPYSIHTSTQKRDKATLQLVQVRMLFWLKQPGFLFKQRAALGWPTDPFNHTQTFDALFLPHVT